MAVTEITIVYRRNADLKLNPKNARKHSDEQVAQIAASIERFGFHHPLLIDEQDVIRAGEGRSLAAKTIAGHDMVPTITLTGITDKEWAALALADNQLGLNSAWDEDVLRSELSALQEDGEDVLGLGFSQKDLDKLFEPEGDDIKVREIATSEVEDRFWIAIRGPLKDQARALAALEKAMKPFKDVEVENGTVEIEG